MKRISQESVVAEIPATNNPGTLRHHNKDRNKEGVWNN